MEQVKINDPLAIERAIHVFDSGGVVMHPTETCYGLAVAIFNEEALKKLYYIKGMPLSKSVSILVADLKMARQYGEFSDKALELAKKYWPGPLSIVVPRRQLLPEFFNPGDEFVSMRVSAFDFCRELVQKFGEPVTTTSANKSGEEQFYTPRVLAGVDLIVDAGEISANKPSTVVKVEDNRVALLRHGGLSVKVDGVSDQKR